MASSSAKISYDEAAFVPERDDEAMMDDTDYRFVKSFQQCVFGNQPNPTSCVRVT